MFVCEGNLGRTLRRRDAVHDEPWLKQEIVICSRKSVFSTRPPLAAAAAAAQQPWHTCWEHQRSLNSRGGGRSQLQAASRAQGHTRRGAARARQTKGQMGAAFSETVVRHPEPGNAIQGGSCHKRQKNTSANAASADP